MFTTMTGRQYLQAEIVCKFDKTYEKKVWDERLACFKTLNLDDPKLYKKASNPIGLRAAVLAYEKTLNGEPTGYMISLDACSSGLQFLSLLVSCPKSWDLCGGRSDTCESAYRILYDAMELSKPLTQKEVKDTIMQALYGSTAKPEKTFGEDVGHFYETMRREAPGAWELNEGLQELWDDISGATYEWVMPDNFHACIETKETEITKLMFLGVEYEIRKEINSRPKFHKGLGPNMIHSVDGMAVREMFRRCMFNPKTIQRVKEAINIGSAGTSGRSAEVVKTLWNHYVKTGFLSVRILDYLFEDTIGLVDETVIIALINTLPKKPFELVSVHDCFRCHPNYGNDLRRQYNTIMADINDSTLLQSMCRDVAHDQIKIKKVGKIDRDLILDADYILA